MTLAGSQEAVELALDALDRDHLEKIPPKNQHTTNDSRHVTPNTRQIPAAAWVGTRPRTPVRGSQSLTALPVTAAAPLRACLSVDPGASASAAEAAIPSSFSSDCPHQQHWIRRWSSQPADFHRREGKRNSTWPVPRPRPPPPPSTLGRGPPQIRIVPCPQRGVGDRCGPRQCGTPW